MVAREPARGLLLDFGGVVLASPFELLPQLEARLGLPAGSIAWPGPFAPDRDPAWTAAQAGELTERQYWERLAAHVGGLVGERWAPLELNAAMYAGPEEEFIRPQAIELVAAARRAGVRTGVLTNELELFHGRAWMERVTLLRRFDVIVDGSVTEVLKPDPRSYRLALRRLDLPAGAVVFVDDQPGNVAGARQAGMVAIHLDVTAPAGAFTSAAAALGLRLRPARARRPGPGGR